MQTAVLDTLRCAQTLKTAGFPPEQAEASAQVLGDALSDVATKTDLDRHAAMQKADLDRVAAERKADLERVAAERKADLDRVETKLDNAIAGVRSELKADLREVKADVHEVKASMEAIESRMVTGLAELRTGIAAQFNKLLLAMIAVAGLLFAAIKLFV